MVVALAQLDAEAWRGLAALVVSLAAIALVAGLVYRRKGPLTARGDAMPFFDHLEELRFRILRGGLIVVLWTTLFLSVRVEPLDLGPVRLAYPVPSLFENIASQVYLALVRTTVPDGVQIIVSTPMEAVAAQMEIALVLGVVVSTPLLLYEAWAFFSPGLASREQRVLRGSIPLATVLFTLGAAFGYALVVPLLFRVLYGFAAPLGAIAFLSAGSLVATVVTMVFLFGVAFELPLVMVGLVRIGVTTPGTYLRKWRHATVLIFIVAAFASDPTLTSQLIIGSLLLVLYWGGVLASYLAVPAQPIVHRNRLSKA